MSRPPTILDFTPPTEREQLLARRARLWAELGEIDAALWQLATEPPPIPVAPPPAEWLSIPEAARRYGWSPWTLRGWARAGKIRTLNAGNRWRIAAADLDAMAAPARGRE